MFKYAEVYAGKVRDLKESALNYIDFCSIFDPTSYWLDVTGIEDIAIGYVIKFEASRGTYFEKPILEDASTDLETQRKEKLHLLNELFTITENEAKIISSLGFIADANEKANRDINGLVTLYKDTPDVLISFCDYNNIIQEITYDELLVLQKEVIINGNNLYAQKWAYRNRILAAESVDDLSTITIRFENTIFDDNYPIESTNW